MYAGEQIRDPGSLDQDPEVHSRSLQHNAQYNRVYCKVCSDINQTIIPLF